MRLSGWWVDKIIIVSGGGSSRDLSKACWAGRVKVSALRMRASLVLAW